MSKIPKSKKEKQYDFLMNPETFDQPEIKDGDFVIDQDCTDQHTAHLLIGVQGDYRADPIRGVGLINYVEHEQTEDELTNEIITQVSGDGMQIEELDVQNMIEKGVQIKTFKPKL